MEKQKWSFLNAHAFSNEKGAWGKFLLFLLPGFFGGTCLNDIIQGRFTWRSIGFFLGTSVVCLILYFITEYLAYRTNLFPKFKKRGLLHMLSFFILFLLAAIIFFIAEIAI